MHRRLLTNFSLGRFDLVLGPSLHCLPPQKPHFLDHPLFDRVGLLEISLRVRYGKGYRYKSLAKTRVRLICQAPIDFQIASLRRITLNRTPCHAHAKY